MAKTRNAKWTMTTFKHISWLISVWLACKFPVRADGRYSKRMHLDPKVICEDLSRSLQEYKWIVDFVSKRNVKGMDDEIGICKEMVELLPLKIAAVRSGRQF